MAPVIIFIIMTTIIIVIIKFISEEMSRPFAAAVVAGTVPACKLNEGACWGNGTDVVCRGIVRLIVMLSFLPFLVLNCRRQATSLIGT